MRSIRECSVLAAAAVLLVPAATFAEGPPKAVITVHGQSFDTWGEYVSSEVFHAYGLRCGTPERAFRPQLDVLHGRGSGASDCLSGSTNPDPAYDPGDIYEIPVVFHILRHTNGDGAISDQLIQSQIDILNEDFMAFAGTPGANGTMGGIQFKLATEDPGGSPTTGIVRRAEYTNDGYFDDSDEGYVQYAWDTNRYLNIWTNTASGNLGYVPAFPQDGIVGNNQDRVVMLWSAVGRDAPIGPPYDQGRTTTHEVGHWIALEHTFNGGCGSAVAPGCYSDGDLICDTLPEGDAGSGCVDPATCGDADPIDNYMDYTDDTCMEKFTVEQVRRMRCTLQFYRPNVFTIVDGSALIFQDGFENGLGAWSSAVQQ